ncbi:hypothetical protein AGDE_15159 [Angomonas deanei]|uniref:Uncharacterized protein n=1 Tax=Angomonas deanei TaxID=59799 RepID=A0A7G2BZV4_9TRYP|nr:hypothetical protein AGDE_15159 [Angomonas deanei]CAD2212990.1 hypothetical protein, conserved [Angomonas deanei]|eukprot:EPY19595.1 hypothetical protein AGDE_15159 [Angomonas deanei]
MHHSDTVEETGTTTAMAKTTILPDRSRFRVKFKSFLFVEAPEKELLLRVTDRKDEALLRTKVFANELRNADKADLSFMVENVALDTISDLRYTVKLSVNKVLRSRPLTSMDFCLCNCDYAAINTRTLRMYNSEDYSFMGLCHLEIVFPDFEGEDELATGNLLPHAITEPIIDDVAALFQLYNPKDLSHLDPTVFKSGDPKALHRLLRQQLAPGVLASVYCAIMKVDLTSKVTAHRIMGKVGNFISHVDRVAGKEKCSRLGCTTTSCLSCPTPCYEWISVRAVRM